jgi:hypothetical protein
MSFAHSVRGHGMQTWLKSGSNCRVDGVWPGKIFRVCRAALKKLNKTGTFSLARRLHCSTFDGPERIR